MYRSVVIALVALASSIQNSHQATTVKQQDVEQPQVGIVYFIQLLSPPVPINKNGELGENVGSNEIDSNDGLRHVQLARVFPVLATIPRLPSESKVENSNAEIVPEQNEETSRRKKRSFKKFGGGGGCGGGCCGGCGGGGGGYPGGGGGYGGGGSGSWSQSSAQASSGSFGGGYGGGKYGRK